MVTFKKVEGEMRKQAETYLGATFPPEVNVYASVEADLVGAGALTLSGRAIRLLDWKAEPAFTEFTLRSLVFVASETGLAVEGVEPQLSRFGFVEENGIYRASSRDVKFPCECK